MKSSAAKAMQYWQKRKDLSIPLLVTATTCYILSSFTLLNVTCKKCEGKGVQTGG